MSHVRSIIQNTKICLMGIELNIWERAKVGIHFNYFVYVNYDNYTNNNFARFCLSFTLVDLKLWIYLHYPTTGASSK
jgi:hypothetical protein